MKIGIDASRANKKNKTGVEWYSYHLIEQLKKIDSHNQYFLYTKEPLRDELQNCPENFQQVRLNWLIPRSWTVIRLAWAMKFGKNKPDLIFLPAHTMPLLSPGRAVVTIHDLGFEHMPSAYHWADKLYHRLIIKVIKRLATKIIAVSEFTKNDLVKTYKIKPEKIAVIHNGYDNEKYKQLPNLDDSILKKYNINAPFLLYIGRLENKKNIAGLVEAFIKFKKENPTDNHKLVLAGRPGLGTGYKKAMDLIETHNFHKQIIQTGWISDDELPKLLNKADLFVFPSLFEGFGIPVIEAMACGCPVICSNTTSLPEVAGTAAKIFDPNNIEQIAQSMKEVLHNENLQQDLINKGLKRAQEFSWQKCAKQTLDIFEKIQ